MSKTWEEVTEEIGELEKQKSKPEKTGLCNHINSQLVGAVRYAETWNCIDCGIVWEEKIPWDTFIASIGRLYDAE